MQKKLVFVFDGPPASGKTTLSEVLARNLRSARFRYKCLGAANIFSAVILRLAQGHSKIQNKPTQMMGDPVLLLNRCLLERIRPIVFITELPYKMFQLIAVAALCLTNRCLVIDEFFVLRAANYINVYLHGGLNWWQSELLMRIDLALLKALAKRRLILYIYIHRHIDDLKKLWRKRENNEEYSEWFLALVRAVWRTHRAQIASLATRALCLKRSLLDLEPIL